MSAPEISVTSTREVFTVYADVTGAEPLPVPFSRNGGTYRPERIAVEFDRMDDGAWKASRPRISGAKIKKDGSPSANRVDDRWGGSPTPEWALEFVALHTPDGER